MPKKIKFKLNKEIIKANPIFKEHGLKEGSIIEINAEGETEIGGETPPPPPPKNEGGEHPPPPKG